MAARKAGSAPRRQSRQNIADILFNDSFGKRNASLQTSDGNDWGAESQWQFAPVTGERCPRVKILLARA
jgi:hypothetical protein